MYLPPESERNRKNSPVRGWKRTSQVAGVDALSPISAWGVCAACVVCAVCAVSAACGTADCCHHRCSSSRGPDLSRNRHPSLPALPSLLHRKRHRTRRCRFNLFSVWSLVDHKTITFPTVFRAVFGIFEKRWPKNLDPFSSFFGFLKLKFSYQSVCLWLAWIFKDLNFREQSFKKNRVYVSTIERGFLCICKKLEKKKKKMEKCVQEICKGIWNIQSAIFCVIIEKTIFDLMSLWFLNFIYKSMNLHKNPQSSYYTAT